MIEIVVIVIVAVIATYCSTVLEEVNLFGILILSLTGTVTSSEPAAQFAAPT